MNSRLVNVRLDSDRVRKVRRLRREGLALSDVMREAIDARYEEVTRRAKARDRRAVMTQILVEHPDPLDLPSRTYSVHNRRDARRAILGRLGRRAR